MVRAVWVRRCDRRSCSTRIYTAMDPFYLHLSDLMLAVRDLITSDFDGIPPPTEVDRAAGSGKSAALLLEEADQSSLIWAHASLDDVRANLRSTDYPLDRIRFVSGRVEQTIPRDAPDNIAILRL